MKLVGYALTTLKWLILSLYLYPFGSEKQHCIRLQSLLSEPATFRRFLDSIQFEVWSWEGGHQQRMEREERGEKELRMKRNKFLVKKTMSFITTTSDPRPLLASLQDTITSHFLAKEGQGGTVGYCI